MKHILIFAVILQAGLAAAQGSLAGVNGDCTVGGQQVLTQGLPSTGTQQIGTSNVLPGAGVMASFPMCSVSVVLSGTANTASIFSDNLASPTPLSNPFVANVDGTFVFFTAQGTCYDITTSSGSGPMLPYSRTYSDVCLGTGTGGGGGGGGVGNGSAGQLAIYLVSGSTVAGDTNLTDLLNSLIYTGSGGITAPILATNGAGGGLVQVGSDGVHAGTVQLSGNTTPPTLVDNTFSILGPNSISFTKYGLQFPPTAPTNGQVPVMGTCSGGVCPVTYGTSGIGIPPNGQTGDTIRLNVYGDSQWDSTQSGFHNGVTMYEVVGTSGPSQYGNVGNSNASSLSNSSPGNTATATDSASRSYTSTAAGSTSTVIGETFGGAPSFGLYSFGSFYRWSSRFKPGNTTSVRYWNGIFRYDTGGTGTETSVCLNNTSLATNTPNKRFIAFRYSAGTDTNWQAVASTGSGGAQTTTDTGVAPDTTAAHTFEITYDGTTARFLIDGVIKVTMTTNIPTGATASAMGCWSGDNENTATAIIGTHYWTSMELK